MKITVVLDNGSRIAGKLPYDNAPFIELRFKGEQGKPFKRYPCGCPAIEADGAPLPLKVGGTGIKHHNHDTFFADAVALCCKKKIGTIETKVSTLFGIEEDEAVFAQAAKMGIKVY